MRHLGVWLGTIALSTAAYGGDSPYAATVVSYSPGLVPDPQYTNPGASLGEPERFTGEVFQFPGCVTPFNPPFGPEEIVSVGGTGSLILGFDHPVVDDPQNPFGLDFIVFGNAGFTDVDYPIGQTTPGGAMFGVGAAARVSVSADGLVWHALGGSVDALYPSLGYSDLTDAYAPAPGAVPSDFTKPVNPALLPGGMNFGQLVAAYDGSGGGTGFDFGPTGLPSVSYIRFENLADGQVAFEIDGVSDVTPVPSPSALFPLMLYVTAWRRRRAHR
ncbi:hypothetical protein PHYC_01521 [Phycisphaerales bacterium]|nr:hypothetical protein PHYC_01521 [Phycisphaerales bacterium]